MKESELFDLRLEGFCMFGHHEPAQATVLYCGDVTSNWEDVHHKKIEFVLEVRAPTGQVFRAKATHHFIRFTHYPQVGDVVNVKYHPKNLEVELDLKGDIRYGEERLKHDEQAERQAGQARRDALLSAPPGTPVPSSTSPREAKMAPFDPELQELLNLEEAERQAARGVQMPAGFPSMSFQDNKQVVMGVAQAQMLRRELERTGASGQAKILQKQQADEPVQRFVPFFVEVQVQPDSLGFPFECSFITWIDTSKGTLIEGYTYPVKYDPQNTTRMVFLFSA